MIDSENNPLVPSGISAVHSKDKFAENQEINKTQAAKYTKEINTPEEIYERFLESPSLFLKRLDSGAIVTTHVPTGSYSPGSVQIMAIRPEIVAKKIQNSEERISTLSIYDFSNDTQVEYWRQVLATYHAVNKQFAGHTQSNYSVLFTENAAAAVSDEKFRVARTVAEPHAQVWIASGDTKPFDEGEKMPKLLRMERRIINLLSTEIIEGLNKLIEQLNREGENSFRISIREAPPNGYIISTPIEQNQSIERQASILHKIMGIHHQLYAEKSKEVQDKYGLNLKEDNKKRLIPQPSYKVYGMFNFDGMLEISIAPTIISQSGVVEALDRRIYRDPSNVPFFKNPDQENWYYEAISRDLES